MKHPTNSPIEYLTEHLQLPMSDVYTQDWDIEMADADRLNEFIDFYINKCTEDHVKIILMKLIISSFDDKICQGNDYMNDWNRIKSILQKDFLIHRETMEYWARLDTEDEDECFAATKFIRQLF